jgi:hypothetical protein
VRAVSTQRLAQRLHPFGSALDSGAIVAGPLALIFSFFDYYTYRPGGDFRQVCAAVGEKSAQEAQVCSGIVNSAWHGLSGWLGAVLALLGALAVAAALVRPKALATLPLQPIAVLAYGLGTLFTLVALVNVPDGSFHGSRIPSGVMYLLARGHGWAYWTVLALVAAGLVLTLARVRRTLPRPAEGLGSQPVDG